MHSFWVNRFFISVSLVINFDYFFFQSLSISTLNGKCIQLIFPLFFVFFILSLSFPPTLCLLFFFCAFYHSQITKMARVYQYRKIKPFSFVEAASRWIKWFVHIFFSFFFLTQPICVCVCLCVYFVTVFTTFHILCSILTLHFYQCWLHISYLSRYITDFYYVVDVKLNNSHTYLKLFYCDPWPYLDSTVDLINYSLLPVLYATPT